MQRTGAKFMVNQEGSSGYMSTYVHMQAHMERVHVWKADPPRGPIPLFLDLPLSQAAAHSCF